MSHALVLAAFLITGSGETGSPAQTAPAPVPVSAPAPEPVPVLLPTSVRLSGTDRYDTAAQVFTAGFGCPSGGAGSVVLARGDAFADALAGSYLAGARATGVLLTAPTSVPAATLASTTRAQLVCVSDQSRRPSLFASSGLRFSSASASSGFPGISPSGSSHPGH